MYFSGITGLAATTFIGTYSISAGGAITIVVPEFDLTANLGKYTTGTANTLDIIGEGITINLLSMLSTELVILFQLLE